MRRRIWVLTVLLLAASALAGHAEEEFTGFIVDAAGALPRKSSDHFSLHVEEYTTDEEAQAWAELLLEHGPQAVLRELRKVEKGYIRVGARLGYPIGLVRSIETPEGRIVRAVTDRPVQMFEVMRGTRSSDHEFGLLEIKIGPDGKGSGQLIAAAEVTVTKDGSVEIESMGTRPFMLQNVRVREKGKHDDKGGKN